MKVQYFMDDGNEVEVSPGDISQGGISFETPNQFNTEAILQIRLIFPEEEEMKVLGSVVHSHPSRDNLFVTGIKFEYLSEADSLSIGERVQAHLGLE